MKTLTLLASGLCVMMLAGGCATLRGDKQSVKFVTEPAGAQVVIDGTEKLTTPGEVTLKRKDAHTIEVSKAGYRPITFVFESTWDGASMTDVTLPGGSALFSWATLSGSDRSFNTLATIVLEKSGEAKPTPVVLYQFRGGLYPKAEYDKLVDEDSKMTKGRFMSDAN